jgi:hypothetical protein
VQTYDLDVRDRVNNYSPATQTPDGYADNIFYFAQQGMSAGK